MEQDWQLLRSSGGVEGEFTKLWKRSDEPNLSSVIMKREKEALTKFESGCDELRDVAGVIAG